MCAQSKLRTELDGFEGSELETALQTMHGLSARYSFETALKAMEQAAQRGGLSNANAVVLAARLSTFKPDGINGPDLSVYDEMLTSEEYRYERLHPISYLCKISVTQQCTIYQ